MASLHEEISDFDPTRSVDSTSEANSADPTRKLWGRELQQASADLMRKFKLALRERPEFIAALVESFMSPMSDNPTTIKIGSYPMERDINFRLGEDRWNVKMGVTIDLGLIQCEKVGEKMRIWVPVEELVIETDKRSDINRWHNQSLISHSESVSRRLDTYPWGNTQEDIDNAKRMLERLITAPRGNSQVSVRTSTPGVSS